MHFNELPICAGGNEMLEKGEKIHWGKIDKEIFIFKGEKTDFLLV